MWVRNSDLDAAAEAPLPIPDRIASNEEFIPPPQSPQQKEYAARLAAMSEAAARATGSAGLSPANWTSMPACSSS